MIIPQIAINNSSRFIIFVISIPTCSRDCATTKAIYASLNSSNKSYSPRCAIGGSSSSTAFPPRFHGRSIRSSRKDAAVVHRSRRDLRRIYGGRFADLSRSALRLRCKSIANRGVRIGDSSAVIAPSGFVDSCSTSLWKVSRSNSSSSIRRCTSSISYAYCVLDFSRVSSFLSAVTRASIIRHVTAIN